MARKVIDYWLLGKRPERATPTPATVTEEAEREDSVPALAPMEPADSLGEGTHAF